mmetsp:Transcript_7655/g.21742  ORF Transcript_7655/g.21742 Transcript_7655/m.21742 type:complete len:203 (-) Transcript_7655:593-1201(-)
MIRLSSAKMSSFSTPLPAELTHPSFSRCTAPLSAMAKRARLSWLASSLTRLPAVVPPFRAVPLSAGCLRMPFCTSSSGSARLDRLRRRLSRRRLRSRSSFGPARPGATLPGSACRTFLLCSDPVSGRDRSLCDTCAFASSCSSLSCAADSAGAMASQGMRTPVRSRSSAEGRRSSLCDTVSALSCRSRSCSGFCRLAATLLP